MKESRKTKISLLFQHIKKSFWSIIKAVGLICMLLCLEHYVTQYWNTHLSSIPKWLLDFQELIPKPSYPEDRDAVLQLISVIASVTGVILALFYPVLATIASTAYSKVHAGIRNLLLSEKSTQDYLRRLTYLTACSITVLLFSGFHIYPGNLILAFLTFYSLVVLFGILKIGLGIYNFFEPSTLSGIVNNTLVEKINDVVIGGENWDDNNFQNHNYKIAFEQLENLDIIISLSLKDDELKESSFNLAINSSFDILCFYLLKKQKIPIESHWFPQIFSHLSYFESDMTKRRLAKNTYSYVQPNKIRNQYWFEEKIMYNISQNLEKVVSTKNIKSLSSALAGSIRISIQLGEKMELYVGKILLDNMSHPVRKISSVNTDSAVNYDRWKFELEAVEYYCSVFSYFIITIYKEIEELTSDNIEQEFKKINWENEESIYSIKVFPELHKILLRMHKNIANEIHIEGKQVTPDWYLKQLFVAEYLYIITKKLSEIAKYFDVYVVDVARQFQNDLNPLLTAFTIQIGMDMINKFRYRINNIKETLSGLKGFEICKDEFKWSSPDFSEIEGIINENEVTCLEILTSEMYNLSQIKWSNQYPDIYAQGYALLANYINTCFENNDSVNYKKVFPEFLRSVLEGHKNLKEIFGDYQMHTGVVNQTIIDVLQISGYAYVYSYLYKNDEFWNATIEAWNEHFPPIERNFNFIVGVYNYQTNESINIGINYIEKHDRENTIGKVGEKLGITKGSVDNPIVREFIKDSYHSHFYDIAEVFIEMYIFTFLDAKNSVKLLKKRKLFSEINFKKWKL